MRFCLILFCLLLSSCAREPLYQTQGYVFGTLVDISIYGEREEKAKVLADHVMRDFQRIHEQLHAWQPDSELSRLNQAIKNGELFNPSPELAEIIADASQFYQQSDGLFNPAIGGLIQLWGFQRDEFRPVEIDSKKISGLVAQQPSMLDINIQNGIASSRNRYVQLDLGGYAKGYALDRAATYLRQQNAQHALINIGGNILALGQHGKKPWRVGIQHPRKPGPIATLDLPDGWAIGTSGDYQRYFELGGKRYCHIIDPRTGYPADKTQAVTILVAPGEHSGTLSDVASKPLFITTQSKLEVARKFGIENILLVDANGQIFVSKPMNIRLDWTEHDVKTQILE